jgi:hypothetical protein
VRRRLGFIALSSLLWIGWLGCAQPQPQRNGSTSTNGGTNGTSGGTTGNADLAMGTDSGSISFPDFGGHDLASSTGDMAGACDPVKQTGCGGGLKCTLDNDAPACLTNGTVATGAACGSGSADDCVASNLCAGLNSQKLLCHQFCAGDGDCKQAPPSGTPASNIGRCLPVQGINYSFCSLPCDPTKAATSCPSPLVCFVGFNQMGSQLTDCEDAKANMTVGESGDCSSSACMAGYMCVTETMSGGATAKKCRRICRATTDCNGIAGVSCCCNAGDIYGVCGAYTPCGACT